MWFTNFLKSIINFLKSIIWGNKMINDLTLEHYGNGGQLLKYYGKRTPNPNAPYTTGINITLADPNNAHYILELFWSDGTKKTYELVGGIFVLTT